MGPLAKDDHYNRDVFHKYEVDQNKRMAKQRRELQHQMARLRAANGLKWGDLNAGAETLSVQRTLVRPRGGGWKFDHTKTKRGKRTLALPDGLITTLLAHRDLAMPREHGLMFVAENGEALDMGNVRRRNSGRYRPGQSSMTPTISARCGTRTPRSSWWQVFIRRW